MVTINYKFIVRVFFLCFFGLIGVCFANPLSEWRDGKAYKPQPVILLHGYNNSSLVWNSPAVELSKWFSKYQTVGPYLETIDFQDHEGSIDTYPDGKAGWADRLHSKIDDLLSNAKYGFYTNKLNCVGYSMGGLAAREFLTNSKYPAGRVNKLVLIGVPNLGSPLTGMGKSLATSYKVGSMMAPATPIIFTSFRDITDQTAIYVWAIDNEAPEAVKDMTPGSDFLNVLNSRAQPAEVKFYGIYGIIGNLLNKFYFKDFYGGDGVVSKESQLGTGHIAFEKNPTRIKAFHTAEPAISVSGDNPLLKFLDSSIPEFQITSPDPGQTTEIYGTSVHIQGTVYKEYLPADSTLTINVTRQEDGTALPTQTSFLKPSDLWIPNNPDSPVAEFDEAVNFPASGTYKISLQIQNPVGLTSDIKDVWVKVNLTEGTNIIVHCHNPEGKEIASIQGVNSNSVTIYDEDALIGYGAHNAATHNTPILISSGSHTIKAKFNGMTKEQGIILNPNETKVITFIFERTEFDITNWITAFNINHTVHTEFNGIVEFDNSVSEFDDYWWVPPYIGMQAAGYATAGLRPGENHWWNATISINLSGSSFSTSWFFDCGDAIYSYTVASILRIEDAFFAPYTIIKNPNFKIWYIQSIQNGYYPVISIGGESVFGNSSYSLSNFYKIAALSANYDYSWARFYYNRLGGFIQGGYSSSPDNRWRVIEGEPTGSYTGSLISKMSSVPYDLIELGI